VLATRCFRRLDTRACRARPLGAYILAPAALVHWAPSAHTYSRLRRSCTGRLGRLHTEGCGAQPLGAFGASILTPSALDLSPRLQMLHPQVTDTGQLTLITETKLTLILTLTLTDTVTLITQTKLTITLALTLTDTVTVIS